MRRIIVLGAMGLIVVGCSKDRPPVETPSTATIRGGQVEPKMISVAEVRAALIFERPQAAADINALIINTDQNVVTLRGTIEDEATRSVLIERVRMIDHVKSIRDELTVRAKPLANTDPPAATTTTTGAQMEGPTQNTGPDPFNTGNAAAAAAPPAEPPKPPVSKAGAIRHEMERWLPREGLLIQNLTITESDGMARVRGTVHDEGIRDALIQAARSTPGVKIVHDNLRVVPKKK